MQDSKTDGDPYSGFNGGFRFALRHPTVELCLSGIEQLDGNRLVTQNTLCLDLCASVAKCLKTLCRSKNTRHRPDSNRLAKASAQSFVKGKGGSRCG